MIRKFNDPALKAVCEALCPGDDLSFIDAMRIACHDFRGVGLAAPQIGVLKRAVFIMPTGKGRCYSLINPRIVRHSERMISDEEGCLSYPGVLATVERYEWVEVEHVDRTHQHGSSSSSRWPVTVSYFSGREARIVQHELDHLDGICRVGDTWREQQSHLQALGMA
jgi:peptide deformylase